MSEEQPSLGKINAQVLLASACVALILMVGIAMMMSVPDLTPLLVGEDMATTTTDADFGKINVNTADKERLLLLSGVGEVMAQRILDYREQHGPFSCLEELMNVKGIGEATLEKLRDQIVF